MENTGIIIQARIDSSRLPNKMILPFYQGYGILELLLKKITINYNSSKITLATTVNSEDDKLEKIANQYGVNIYRGSKNNVLSRFIHIAQQNNYDNVIRICADNPFFLVGTIRQLKVEIENTKNLDYVSFSVHNKPSILSHFGLWGEAASVKALKKTLKMTNNPIYYEHVTNYIHTGNSKIFNVKLLKTDDIFDDINDVRLTIDTKEDFNVVQKIFCDLHKNDEEITFSEIIDYLNKNEDLKLRMKKEIVENEK